MAEPGDDTQVAEPTLPPAGGSPEPSTAMMHGQFRPGAILDERYRIVSLLGKGGMGEVYRADDLRLKQPVALKMLPQRLASERALVEALYNEVTQARRVSHRNVCRVHDVGESEGNVYLSMAFIEGEDLGTLIRRIGRLPRVKALELGRQLCEGVQAGHDERVLHLDLKPANLMIDQRGELQISDFGLARLTSDEAMGRRIAGTPTYMAPEQLLHGEATVKCDLYAVGLILLEMLTGKRGITGTGVDAIREFHVDHGIIDVPEEWRALLGDCLDRDPGKRPETLKVVTERLSRWLENADDRSESSFPPASSGARKQLSVLLHTELVGSLGLQQELGAEAYTRYAARHDQLISTQLAAAEGAEILSTAGDGFLVRFLDPSEAVKTALSLQAVLREEDCEGKAMRVRMGLHMGLLTAMDETQRGERRMVGMAIHLAEGLMEMAEAGQILLTSPVHEEARQYVRAHPPIEGSTEVRPELEWRQHGLYRFEGRDEALEIFEIGAKGKAPFTTPTGGERGATTEVEPSAADEATQTASEIVEDSDVFISYAPVDDRPLSPGQSGWISQFHRNLETRIEQLSGESIKVVQRPPMSEEEAPAVEAEILQHVPKMKAMISVVSPPYIKSKTCAREVETFWRNAVDAGNLRLDDRTRLLKVVKTPVMEGDVPAPLGEALSDLLSFDFFSVDPDTGRLWEFDETFGVEARRRYYERVYDLAYDLCHILRAFQRGAASSDAAGDGQTIYLAETTRDLQSARDRLRRELQERGHIILPDRPLPLNGPELEKAMSDCLERCSLSIHLIGSVYGLIPEEAEQSVVQLQNEIAARHAQTCSSGNDEFARFIWLPRDRGDVEERQAQFIQRLIEDPESQFGADLIEDSLEEFKEILLEELAPKPEPKQEEPAAISAPEDRTASRIYLICEPADEEAIEPLEDFLFDQGFEVTTPHFEGDESEISNLHRQNLVHCDAALIYYGAGSKAWVDTKLMDLAQARGYGRERPILAKVVYIAPPLDRRKQRFRTHDADVIRPETWDPGLLEPFVKHVKTQAALVTS